MSGKTDRYLVIHIEPIWVMISSLSEQRHLTLDILTALKRRGFLLLDGHARPRECYVPRLHRGRE